MSSCTDYSFGKPPQDQLLTNLKVTQSGVTAKVVACQGDIADLIADNIVTNTIHILHPEPEIWEYSTDSASGVDIVNLNPALSESTDRSFVVPGTTLNGAGSRIMFDHSSGSVRAGTVTGTEWDNAQRGAASAAFGLDNIASGNYSSISGGSNNLASGISSAVVGGVLNIASNSNTFMGGGSGNTASGIQSVVLGGSSNHGTATDAFVGGGSNSTASGNQSAVVGGNTNLANGLNAAVVAGHNNQANAANSVVVGGYSSVINSAATACVTLGGSITSTSADDASTAICQNFRCAASMKTTGLIIVNTGTYALTVNDYIVICNTSGGGVTLTLPNATFNGINYIIKNINGVNNIVINIAGGSADQIAPIGAIGFTNTYTVLSGATPGASVTLIYSTTLSAPTITVPTWYVLQ